MYAGSVCRVIVQLEIGSRIIKLPFQWMEDIGPFTKS